MKKVVANPIFVPALLIAALVIAYLTVPPFQNAVGTLWGKATGNEPFKIKSDEGPAELVFNITFKTKQGDEFTGLLLQDSPQRLVIRLESGEKTFDRKDVDQDSITLSPVGLELTPEAVKGVRPESKLALDPFAKDPRDPLKPVKQRALPLQFGTINYDNEGMFQIRTRFAGEIAQLKLEKTGDGFVPRYETDSISPRTRPIRVGDKVKQNELLAVIWSVPIGQAKSALMDAICSLALSNQQWKLKEEAYAKGAMSTAAMLIADRTTQADTLTRLSAERSLWTWKLTKEDIKEIENEAEELRKLIIANKLPDPNKEDKKWAEVAKALAVKWSRVEVRAPIYKTIKDIDGKDIPDPNVLLTVVEKNTNLNDYVDPIATPYPLYKLADLSRLQVMVQPHEEYYPILRSQLEARKLNWKIEVDSLPNDKPLSPPIIQVLQSLDPGLRTCIVTGYLQSDDLPVPKGQAEGFQEGWFGKYLVGQFVRATIFVDPEKDTVEIPTDALYEAEGESLVFVQDAKEKEKFYVKRVSVVQRFKEFTYVRSVLSQRDRDINPAEAEKGKRRIEALLPGELVVTHGVVELNRAFDNLASRDRIERLQNQAK